MYWYRMYQYITFVIDNIKSCTINIHYNKFKEQYPTLFSHFSRWKYQKCSVSRPKNIFCPTKIIVQKKRRERTTSIQKRSTKTIVGNKNVGIATAIITLCDFDSRLILGGLTSKEEQAKKVTETFPVPSIYLPAYLPAFTAISPTPQNLMLYLDGSSWILSWVMF